MGTKRRERERCISAEEEPVEVQEEEENIELEADVAEEKNELETMDVDAEFENENDDNGAPEEFNDEEFKELLLGLSSKSEDFLTPAIWRMRRLLAQEGGGKILEQYVLTSPKCIELMEAWAAGPRSRTCTPLLLLLPELFRHPKGLRNAVGNDDCSVEEHRRMLAVQLRLDKFALSIVLNKLPDIYAHISSGQRMRINGALRLLTSVVLRSRLIAKQVASKFDFTLEALRKLAKHPRISSKEVPSQQQEVLKLPTRVAFTEFALSFLVIGDSGLLRWILQKRILYAGVLHGLANDDEDTVIQVLAIIRKKILESKSVPQGLQCAIFGDAALEQLARITASPLVSEATDLAHNVLTALCTDPSHGICPSGSSWEDSQKSKGQFGGGAGRLLRLMLRLQATEVEYHRQLLLAIAKSRPLIGAAYIDAFPYSLEPRASDAWFSAVSLISTLIGISSISNPFASIAAEGFPAPLTDSALVQSSLRRIWPQTLSRALVTRGLLHSHQRVRHACVNLLLEVLQSVQRLLSCIRAAVQQIQSSCLDLEEKSRYEQSWLALASYVQDKARMVLPDCHTLLSLYSSVKQVYEGEVGQAGQAEQAEKPEQAEQAEKPEQVKQIVGAKGNNTANADAPEAKRRKLKSKDGDAHRSDSNPENPELNLLEEGVEDKSLLHAKLLDVFALYQESLPLALSDINFDPFKFVPEDLKDLSHLQQQSLLNLLFSSTGVRRHSGCLDSNIPLLPLYKQLKLLMKMMVNSKSDDIKEKVQLLIRAAITSTGAFDNNLHEAEIWLVWLPGWKKSHAYDDTVSTFFCDVVLSLGKNMYKYLDQLHSYLGKHSLDNIASLAQDATACEFGPLVVSALEIYKLLTGPKAKSLKIPQRAKVAVYLSGVLQSLLSIQEYPRSLAVVITSILSDQTASGCEWNPLNNIRRHAEAVLEDKLSYWCSLSGNSSSSGLVNILEACERRISVDTGSIASALESSLFCVDIREVVECFFQLLRICWSVLSGDCSALVSLLGAYPQLFSEIAKSHPAVFSNAVRMASSTSDSEDSQEDSLDSDLGCFIRTCSFFTLFSPVTCGSRAELLLVPHSAEILTNALDGSTDTEKVIAARMIMSKINTLFLQHIKGEDVQTQLDASFHIFEKIFFSCESEAMLTLLNDFLSHPVIREHFLGGKEIQINKDSSLEKLIQEMTSSLNPLDSHVVYILQRTQQRLVTFDVDCGRIPDSFKSLCRPLLEKAGKILKAELQESSNSYVPTPSFYVISVLGPYFELDLLIVLLQEFPKNLFTNSAFRLLWLQLATLVFKYGSKTTISKEAEWYAKSLIDIYNNIVTVTMMDSSDVGNSCLLTAMQTIHSSGTFPVLATSTPLEVLYDCMVNVDKVKTELVLLLIQENPVHFSLFGRLIASSASGVFDRPDLQTKLMCKTDFLSKQERPNISDKDLMLLLPAVELFLSHDSESNRESANQVGEVYLKLLTKQLTEWEVNVGTWIDRECDYKNSLLSNVVRVFGLALKRHSLSPKLKHRLLRSLLPRGTKLLDEGAKDFSSDDLRRLTNRIVGKTLIVGMILLDEQEDLNNNDKDPEMLQFISNAIATLSVIYKKLVKRNSNRSDPSMNELLNFLEEIILKCQSDVMKRLVAANPSSLEDIIRTMAKAIFRYRFAEVLPMKTLQNIFTQLLKNVKMEAMPTVQKLSSDVLSLLVGHSEFVSTLLTKETISSTTKGTVLTSVSSMLSLLGSPADWKNKYKANSNSSLEHRRMSIVRLLRVLYAFRVRFSNHEVSPDSQVTSRELLSLLLAAYGASLSPVDQEIFNLMREIEVAEGPGFTGMSGIDYLWGNAALQRRKEKTELDTSFGQENWEEIRKRRFKEDLALDPGRCAMTVLKFPVKRDAWSGALNPTVDFDEPVYDDANLEGSYDPSFIIAFAMHGLSVRCIDPEEFVRLGLLGIAFSSTSSSSESMRKSGYELLSKFMCCLEECQSFKGKSQIVMLLAYVKNAITESWQRIPSVTSVFAAEASCILMHPENPHYLTVNRFLLRSPSIDLECVPLFQSMFASGSMHARSERIWMLRLLFAGLVTYHDARIYRRQFVAEILMSFASSSMSDTFIRKWILQVIRKAAAIPSYAESLIDNTGLLSWLSSFAINYGEAMVNESDEEDATTALQVIENILSQKRNQLHLLTPEGVGECSKVALRLYQFLACSATSSKQMDVFKTPVLHIIKAAFKVSQKRKKYGSYFGLSFKGLHQMVKWVSTERHDTEIRLATLQTLLQSSPPSLASEEAEAFLGVASWAYSVCLEGNILSAETLRWLSAALIHGTAAEIDVEGRSKFREWWSVFRYLREEKKKIVPIGIALQLQRLVICLSSLDIGEKQHTIVPAVHGLLILLLSTSKGEEVLGVLEVLLSEIGFPYETNSSSWWSDDGFEEEYKILYSLLRQMCCCSEEILIVRCLSSFQHHHHRRHLLFQGNSC